MIERLTRHTAFPGLLFLGLLLAYEAIFGAFFPAANGRLGHDYAYVLPNLLDGYFWFKNNGFLTPPWFTPSLCGGQAFFADPQSAFYALPQFLTFLIDPLQAIHATLLIFASLGFYGSYRFARQTLGLDVLSASINGTVFMFNGFFAHRMLIGHSGFHGAMLIPLMASLLLPNRLTGAGTRIPVDGAAAAANVQHDLLAGMSVGILAAYAFHAGLSTLMLPAALAVTVLLCLALRCRDDPFPWAVLFRRSGVAILVTLGLSAAKLQANAALMAQFPRDYYPLPGIADLADLLTVVFQSLFYSSQHAAETAAPLWQNMQWAAGPHELAFGLTPLAFVLLLLGAASALRHARLDVPDQPPTATSRSEKTGASALLLLLLTLPLALLYYSPEWNATLKSLPLIGSTTSPYRWLLLYLPLLAVLCGLAVSALGPRGKPLALLLLLAIPALHALEDRTYYQHQPVDPARLTEAYFSLQALPHPPPLREIIDPRTPEGQPIIDNQLFIYGVSPLRCYNPLYGYRLEKLVTAPLEIGPISRSTVKNTLNLHNPACLVFPQENQCQPWDAFRSDQAQALGEFAAYRPFPFAKSVAQQLAAALTQLTLGALVLIPLFLWLRRFKSTGETWPQRLRHSLSAHPVRQWALLSLLTAGLVFLATRGLDENAVTAARAAAQHIFVAQPQLIRPEPGERLAYLLTLLLFPLFAVGLAGWLHRPAIRPITPDLATTNIPAYRRALLPGLFISLAIGLLFIARESSLGTLFLFSDYLPILALREPTQLGWRLGLALLLAALLLRSVSRLPGTTTQPELRPRRVSGRLIDGLSVLFIVLFSARISFIPETTGAFNWTPDAVHVSPIFEVAAKAYLGSATVGADMISQYGGVVEFIRPWLAAWLGDALGLYGFFFVALVIALLAQWATLRRLTGHPFLAGVGIVAIVSLSHLKFQFFACFQCGSLRWFWPSLFLYLAARQVTAHAEKNRGWVHPQLPYLLFPLALYWNTETGLACLAAWMGWQAIEWLLPRLSGSTPQHRFRQAVGHITRSALALLAGSSLVIAYIVSKSGAWPQPGLMLRFAQDFYLYGFGMLPMPTLHLWTLFVLVAGLLFVTVVNVLARPREAESPQPSERPAARFILFALLLFALLFSYYQGRSFYSNLLLISYPFYLALLVSLPYWRRATARGALIAVFALAAATTLTTGFHLPATVNPLERQNLEDKAALRAWIKETRQGRPVAFVSFSAWRLMLISGQTHPAAIPPLAALLKRDQLDDYLAWLRQDNLAIYVDANNDRMFAMEGFPWRKELERALDDRRTREPAREFANGQIHLRLIN